MHDEKHPLANKTVKLNIQQPPHPDLKFSPAIQELEDQEYWIEDWHDRVAGKSWVECEGNPAVIKYAVRNGLCHLPIDDEVVYGKSHGLGHLIHVSELGEVIKEGR